MELGPVMPKDMLDSAFTEMMSGHDQSGCFAQTRSSIFKEMQMRLQCRVSISAVPSPWVHGRFGIEL